MFFVTNNNTKSIRQLYEKFRKFGINAKEVNYKVRLCSSFLHCISCI